MGGGIKYIVDPRSRYRSLQLNNWLASRVTVLTMLACLGVGSAATLAALTEQISPEAATGTVAFALGLLGLLAWLFAYAVTWRPHLPPPSTTTDLLSGQTQNVANTADYPLIELLGMYFNKGQPGPAKFMAALLQQASVRSLLARLEVDADDVKAALQAQGITKISWDALAQNLVRFCASSDRLHISTVDVLAALLTHEHMRAFLRQHNVQEKDIQFVVWWHHAKSDFQSNARRWWDAENMLDFTGIGLSWAAGYTPFVDRFSRAPSGSAWDVGRAHEEQVETLITSLARRQQSNVLLVGQPGVGRIGVVKELMRRVQANKAHPTLNGQRMLYVHVSQLVSLGKDSAAQLSFISRALDEMERAGNIIAVLDGLGSILGGEKGQIDITEVLVPFFSSPTVRVVVVMSLDDYHQSIAGNQELEHLFEVIEVPPTSPETTLQVLALSVDVWEQENEMFVPYRTLREIVESTVSILPHIPFPEKAFDVLEELIALARGENKKIIHPEDVHALITRKTGVPFGRIKAQESEKLLSLGEAIHRRVVNQEQGVQAVAHAMVRARAGIRSHDRPIGSFLFLGPTGVGKTETAKALSEAYFGSTEYMQRLDMSEFQGEDAPARLIGTVEKPLGRLPALVAEHPFSVILLDEFEKASHAVQEIFLPLLDEGYITDARGRRYSFIHTIIIATSNAGAELIREGITTDGRLPEKFDIQLREHILREHIFLPELLNRFDGIVTFTPLSLEHIRKIAHLMLINLNKRLDAEHGITIRITDELVNFLAASGYDPQFGARPMRRLIQDTVEYWAAEQIMAGRTQPGQEIVMPVQQQV